MAKIELNSEKVGEHKKYIKRLIERVVLEDFNSSKALAITGARQVGKTTITKHLYPNIKRVNMKDNFLFNSALEDPYNFLKSYGRPFFINEVQKTPFLLDEVKVF